MTAEKPKKYFTVEEANNALPLVRRVVADIVAVYQSVLERRERLKNVREHSGGSVGDVENNPYRDELQQFERGIEQEIQRVEEFLDELQSLHVELKDPVVGLIDFPAMIGGREVYLCWKLGEEEVTYWHEIDGGFSSRQPLLVDLVVDHLSTDVLSTDSLPEDES